MTTRRLGLGSRVQGFRGLGFGGLGVISHPVKGGGDMGFVFWKRKRNNTIIPGLGFNRNPVELPKASWGCR